MTTKTYDKRPPLPAGVELIESSTLPPLPAGVTLDVEKKNSVQPSKDGVEVLPTGTESTSPSKSSSPLPFDVEGIFSFGKVRNKKAAMPVDLLRTVNDVQKKVFFGDVKPQELSTLYNKEGGKEVVKNLVRQYAPEIPEEFIGSGESLDVAAKNIFSKNRINFVNAETNGVGILDKNISNNISTIKTPAPANKAGRLTDNINELKAEIGITDYTNNDNISGLISKVKRLQDLEQRYYLKPEERKQSSDQTQSLINQLNNRLYHNISKTGVTPTLNQLDKEIEQAVLSKVIEGEKGTNENEVGADNEKVNHFKLGMTAVEKSDPVLFNLALNSIAQNKKVSDTDFTNISRIGQEIANTTRFRGAAYDPNLRDTETDYEYLTFGQKVAQASAKIGEWAKKKGYKNRAEFSDEIIQQGAKETGEDNQEVVKTLMFNEKLKFYDAIPKAGAVDDIFGGAMEPLVGINSTLNSWNESPSETYLRSKSYDSNVGGQQVPDDKGEFSAVLPSERGKVSTEMLRGLGQFIPQVILTRGLGGVGRGIAGAAGLSANTAKARNIADLTSTAISTYLQSYGPSYEESLQKTGDAETASLIAKIDATASAGFETFILPDIKIADKAFRGLKQALATDLIALVKKGGDPAELAQKARPFVQKFFTNVTGTILQEDAEEVGTNYVDFVTESIFDPASAKDRNLNKELWDTFKATSVSMALPAILGAGGQSVQKDFTVKTLHSSAINFDSYKESLQNSLDKGYLDQNTFNGAVQILSTHKQSIDAAPQQNINGNSLAKEQQLDYAYEDTKIKVYKEKASSSEGVAKEMWESKIKQSEDIQREILMPKEGEVKVEPVTVVDENARFQPQVQEVVLDEKEVASPTNEAKAEPAAENVVPSTLEGTPKIGDDVKTEQGVAKITGFTDSGSLRIVYPDGRKGVIVGGKVPPKADQTRQESLKSEPKNIAELFNKFDSDDNFNFDDLVNGVEALAEDFPQKEQLLNAVADYRKEQEFDRSVSGRGDLDAAQKTFEDKIKYIENGKPKIRESADQLQAAQPEGTISRVLPTVEPADKKGRTPVTLTGNTEQERQSLIKRRKADTFVPTNVSDEQKLLDRVNKFNKEGLRFKRSTNGRSELNNIKVAVDSYNKTHKQKYSAIQNRTGNIEFKNTKGDKVRTNNKVTGDLSIDDKGVPLNERSEKTKDVFNELLDKNLFPTGYTVDGRKMNEKQLDGAIQDILDGIPSRGATNYLNALEKMIEKNDFDFSTPDISQQEPITFEDITATEKENVGDVMDEKAVEDFLNEQSNLTPEQEQIVSDNLETLIDEYEIIGDTGQVQTSPEGSQTTGSTTTESNQVSEDEKAEATPTSENKFDAKVDKAADAIIKFLTPKVKVDAQKAGLGVEEIVRAGAAAIKAAYKIEQNIEKAISKGIAEMKKLWSDAGFEDFPEDGLREVMQKEFSEPAPTPKPKPVETAEQKSDNEIILEILSLPVDAKAFPTLFQGNEEKQQLAADTQGKGQDREVNIEYIVALDKDLKEVSIQAAKSLKDQLGVNWGEKTLNWLEKNPARGNLAQVIGVLNVMSTENFQDIQDTHDGNKLNKLKRLQNRIDVVAATRAREASLGLRQRSMYVQFAKGGNMRDVLDNAILTNEMLDLQGEVATVLSQEVTDEEINNAQPIKPTPPKKQSLIRMVTGQAKRQSSSSLKDDLKNKAADIANRTKKSFKELVADANAKIKNIKC